MKNSALITALCALPFFSSASALPAKRADAVNDVDILNFALTLEHLENVYYRTGLERFSQEDFAKAGFPDWVRNRFEQISYHESTHVKFLTTALEAAGAPAVKECQYDFPDNDARSFVEISALLETTGSSAYAGAAALISNKDYLTAAASILSTETRQSAWVQSAALESNPWSGPFETPLSANHVITIAAPFIKSCPESNPKLPFKPFPQLTFPTNAHPGQKVTLSFDAPAGKELFAAFLNDNNAIFVPLQGKDVVIPQQLKGTTFIIVTDSKEKADDAQTVAGPALVLFAEDSRGVVA